MNEKSHIPHPFEIFGVECHKGWFDILKPIFSYVQEYNKDKKEEEQIKFLQIKEKWGSLDIYTNFSTFKLTKLIEEAQEKADHTCEECGSTENIGVRLNGCVLNAQKRKQQKAVIHNFGKEIMIINVFGYFQMTKLRKSKT